MKMKAVVAVLLISMLLVEDVESWRIRIRLRRIGRALRRIWKPVCKFACPRTCKWVLKGSIFRHACGFGCRKVCGRKRRELSEEYHFTPLPIDFEFYDLNNDKQLTVYEIADSLGQLEIDEGLYMAFNQTDIQGKEYLLEDEFFSSTTFVFSQGREETEI